MNHILESLISGAALSVGLCGGIAIIMAFCGPARSKSDEYNRRTVELLEERNKTDERIASALERIAKGVA